MRNTAIITIKHVYITHEQMYFRVILFYTILIYAKQISISDYMNLKR